MFRGYKEIGSILAIAALSFAGLEKIHKEQFVLINTNTRTRKKLMIMLEKSLIATAIIGKTGNIFFYNQEFKSLCLDEPPENIYSLFKGDDRSSEQLMKLIQT